RTARSTARHAAAPGACPPSRRRRPTRGGWKRSAPSPAAPPRSRCPCPGNRRGTDSRNLSPAQPHVGGSEAHDDVGAEHGQSQGIWLVAEEHHVLEGRGPRGGGRKVGDLAHPIGEPAQDRKSTRLNSSHVKIS